MNAQRHFCWGDLLLLPSPLLFIARRENGFLLVIPVIQWKLAASFLNFVCRKRTDIRGCCGMTVAFSCPWWELEHCFQEGMFVSRSPSLSPPWLDHTSLAQQHDLCPLWLLTWKYCLPADTFLKQEGTGEKKGRSRLWFTLTVLLGCLWPIGWVSLLFNNCRAGARANLQSAGAWREST